jgi:hypothetical protein
VAGVNGVAGRRVIVTATAECNISRGNVKNPDLPIMDAIVWANKNAIEFAILK